MLTYAPIIQASLIVLAYLAFTAWCMRKQWFKRRVSAQAGIIVAYASAGGSAEKLAKQLAANLESANYSGCMAVAENCQPPSQAEGAVCLLTLNQLKPEQLKNAQTLFVVASTYGEGEAPDNGFLFEDRLKAAENLDLSHLKIAVLALGDSGYKHFCGFGVRLFEALTTHQAQAMFAPVLVDDLNPDDLDQWQQQLQEHDILTAEQISSHLKKATVHNITLLERQCLNQGSQGAAMQQITFASHNLPSWQAGDIAKLHINGQEREYTIATVPAEKNMRLLVREKYFPNGNIGLGSGFLCKTLNIAENAQFSIRSNPSFYAPSANTPMILIGNGTGLAGLRAHLKQREGQSQQNWLIYGERSPVHDRPWNAELDQWLNSGHLQQLDLTFSRHDGCQYPDGTYGRCHQGYVQQVIRSQAAELKQWIEQGAAIYLCGSKEGMAEDVNQALTDVLGEPLLNQLIEQERFKRDVY